MINWYYFTYFTIFILLFIISYYVVLATRLENLFKQGRIIEIRIAQVLVALILSTITTFGIMSCLGFLFN